MPAERVLMVVYTDIDPKTGDCQMYLPAKGFEPEELPTYETLPPGLIDLSTASKPREDGGFGVSHSTMLTWVQKGRVERKGYFRGGRGARRVVVDKNELDAYIHAPRNKGGRPKGAKGKKKRR